MYSKNVTISAGQTVYGLTYFKEDINLGVMIQAIGRLNICPSFIVAKREAVRSISIVHLQKLYNSKITKKI